MPPPKDTEPLIDRLDELLAQHLDLLDSYTTLRAQLSEQFSSGFFSLAVANRNAAASLGAGRKFGEEGFDGRMKAGRVVRIGEDSEVECDESTAQKEETTIQDETIETTDGEAPGPRSTQEQSDLPSRLSTLKLSSHSQTAPVKFSIIPTPTPPPPEPASPDDEKTTPKPARNPLNWYTPLPPPALRQTQQTFVSSLDTLKSLINATQELDARDAEVRRAREELERAEEAAGENGERSAADKAQTQNESPAAAGNEGGEDGDDAEAGVEAHSRPSYNKSVGSSQKGQVSSMSRIKGVGSAKEPRSRVLKMQ